MAARKKKMSTEKKVLIGVTVAGLAYMLMKKGSEFVGTYRGTELRKKVFRVGEGCSISIVSQGDTAEEIQENLDDFWEDAILPTIERSWEEGRYSVNDLTQDVMERFFPEDECSWPPGMNAPAGQHYAYAFVRREILSRLACEGGVMLHPEHAGAEIPDGFVCIGYDPVGSALELLGQASPLFQIFGPLANVTGSIMDRLPGGFIAPQSAVMAATG